MEWEAPSVQAHMEPVHAVHSTWRIFHLWGLAEWAKVTPVLYTYYRDTKYQLGNFVMVVRWLVFQPACVSQMTNIFDALLFQSPKANLYRVINTALACERMSGSSSALLPLSLTSKLGRKPGPPISMPYLQYKVSRFGEGHCDKAENCGISLNFRIGWCSLLGFIMYSCVGVRKQIDWTGVILTNGQAIQQWYVTSQDKVKHTGINKLGHHSSIHPPFFTRGQFLPLGIVVACFCLCVHLLIRPYALNGLKSSLKNVWRNNAGSLPNWVQDFNGTSQKNNDQHSRNFGRS